MKTGIIQSRGLGDIIIALPIAHYYHKLGNEIHWPICKEFYSSVVDAVPWVNWHAIETDPEGRFFFDEPARVLESLGIKSDCWLYLYQYLSSMPEMTDPELFNILKFDQYKYWAARVPFTLKWSLPECIVRDHAREEEFKRSLALPERYAVVHTTGSTSKAEVDLVWLKNLAIVHVEDHLTSSIFDWITVLEGAEAFVGIDSAMANLVDCLNIDIAQKYWIRRSSWDLTPVLGHAWTIVPNMSGLADPVRVNPVEASLAKRKIIEDRKIAVQAQKNSASQLTSSVPFASKQSYPTSFLHTVKK